MLTRLVGYSSTLRPMASVAIAIVPLSLAACETMRQENSPTNQNGLISDIPSELSQALEDAGFPDVRTVVLVQPDETGEKFSVFFQGFTAAKDFEVSGDNFVVLPRLEAGGLMAQRIGEIETLVILLEQSPETVVVCNMSGGDKICWEEER